MKNRSVSEAAVSVVYPGGKRVEANRTRKRGRDLRRTLVPLLTGAIFVVLWQIGALHSVLHLRTYQLPLPATILEAMRANGALLLDYTGYTLAEALLGMLAGSALGFILALAATVWPKWGSGGVLLTAALNAVPIVALAPIMNLWFGDGLGSRVAIVAVTTMAALAVNAHKGMNAVEPLMLDFMKANAASKWAVFRYVRLQNGLPHVFTALKINTTAAMIGAIVGEFFYSSKGLGYLLSNSIKVAKMPLGWSCIVAAAVAGLLFYGLADRLEKVCIRWLPAQRD